MIAGHLYRPPRPLRGDRSQGQDPVAAARGGDAGAREEGRVPLAERPRVRPGAQGLDPLFAHRPARGAGRAAALPCGSPPPPPASRRRRASARPATPTSRPSPSTSAGPRALAGAPGPGGAAGRSPTLRGARPRDAAGARRPDPAGRGPRRTTPKRSPRRSPRRSAAVPGPRRRRRPPGSFPLAADPGPAARPRRRLLRLAALAGLLGQDHPGPAAKSRRRSRPRPGPSTANTTRW